MKKAFPLRKRLSAALAIVLSVACFAGAVPANATGEYSYSPVGNYGTFEDYMWGIVDDSDKAYELSFAAVDGEVGIPVATKTGSDSASPWAKLYTRKISLTAGAEYQVSFKIKSADANTNSRFKLFGVKYAADGTLPSDHNITFSNVKIDGNSAEEAALSENWTDYTAEFTVDSAAPLNEFRIWIPGNKGTQITVKSFDVKQITEQTVIKDIPYFNTEWQHVYSWVTDGSVGYSNPNLENCKIELAENGCGNKGALHFYKNGEGGKELRIHRVIPSGIIQPGKTYVFAADVMGTTTTPPDGMYVEFLWNFAIWSDNSSAVALESKENWENVQYEFSAPNSTEIPICIKTGGYTTADYYIDNIVIYDKDDVTKTNLIPGGDFCKTAPATTMSGWTDIHYNNPDATFSYYNPNLDTCKIELSDEGADGTAGSVHFIKKNLGTNDQPVARICYQIQNAALEKYPVGTEFVFEAKTKGTSPAPVSDSMRMSIEHSPYSWTDGSANDFRYELNSDTWVTFSKAFKKNAAGDLFIIVRNGGYTAADFYVDNIKVYPKDDPGTNLISNSTFCETESVVSDSSAIDNSEFKVTNIPGYDIGMLAKDGTNAYAVPGGSRDGSTALKITSTGVEAYFQTKGDETFDDDLSKGKIALVKGDIAVKASGYFKELDGSSSKAEPKVWFGLGKNLKIGTKTGSSVGSHYKSSSDRYDTEVFETLADGWVRFEMTLNDTLLKKANSSLSDVGRVRVMCGVDADDSKTTYGAALFDDIKVEIISQYAAGDTNGDNSIDIRDLVHMKRYAAGAVKFTEMTRGTWLSDIGYDESPSVTNELVAMRKFLVGAASEYCK